MNRTLLILATHFIDENVISEFRKMQNTPNVDAVLAINNTSYQDNFKARIEQRIFFGTSARCFFFDSKLHEEMNLPYYTFSGTQNFGGVTWHNCDYRFYYVRKFFPDYDYYWLIEYDVFCNAPTYAGFLSNFENVRSDLLASHFRLDKRLEWNWALDLDWVYEGQEIYGILFCVVRLTGRAIDFLYRRRLEHKEIFQQSNEGGRRWIFCELFAPTELMNNGYSCSLLAEDNLNFAPNIYLNDNRFFLAPDNHLYHPVKSIDAEISKLNDKYDKLYFCLRKIFLLQFIEQIRAKIPANFLVQIGKDFNRVIFTIPEFSGGGGLHYELSFFNERIYIALVFSGKYATDENFAVVKEFTGLNRQPPNLQLMPLNKALIYVVGEMDSVAPAVSVTQFLIENTYPVLRKKFFQ